MSRRWCNLWLTLSAVAALAAEPVKLASGEWPPYAGALLPHGGVAERIIVAAFAESHIPVEFVRLSWKRGLEVARQGKLTGAILWGCADDPKPAFLVSDPVIISDIVLFYRTATPINLHQPQQVQHYQLAYPDEYGYENIPVYRRLLKASSKPPMPISSDALAIASLLNGRIDAYPIDRQVGTYLLEQATPGTWRTSVSPMPALLNHANLCVLISRQQAHGAELLAQFNQALAKLRSNGQIKHWLAEQLPAKP